MSVMKQFRPHIPEILVRFGSTPSFRDVEMYCYEHQIQVPKGLHSAAPRSGRYDFTHYAGENPLPPPPASLANFITTQNINTPRPPMPNVTQMYQVPKFTDEQIVSAIREKFEIAEWRIESLIDGHCSAVIMSGPPGVGKTWNTIGALERAAEDGKIQSFHAVTGYARATGLFKLLYDNREKGQVILFDDTDSIFDDMTGLNILKAALDTTGRRRMISWRSEKKFTSSDTGEELPPEFEYKGSLIFITNIDFEMAVARKVRNHEHLGAVMSRCTYVNLQMHSVRELMLRIEMVARESSMLNGFEPEEIDYLMDTMKKHAGKFRELSLRTLKKISQTYLSLRDNPERFEKLLTTEFHSKQMGQYVQTLQNDPHVL